MRHFPSSQRCGYATQLGRATVTRLFDLRELLEDDVRWRGNGDADNGAAKYQSASPATLPSTVRQAIICFFSPPTTAPTTPQSPAIELMDDYASFVREGMEFDDPDLPRPGVSIAGRYLVVTARPSQQATVAGLLDAKKRASRPVRRIEPEPGQVRKERTGVGSGLFAR